MRMFKLFLTKKQNIFEHNVVSARMEERGVEENIAFSGQEKRGNFANLCILLKTVLI